MMRLSVCKRALAATLLVVLLADGARAEELRSAAEAEALCAFSDPSSAAQPGGIDPLVLSAGKRSYLFERTGRLFGVYSVRLPTEGLDVRVEAAPPADLQAPDQAPAMTSACVVIDTKAALRPWSEASGEQGAFSLQLSAPQLVFDGLTQEDSARIVLAHRAGLLALEVDFWLDAASGKAYCEAKTSQIQSSQAPQGMRVVKGIGLEARLRHVGSQEVWASMATDEAMTFRARFAPDAAAVGAQSLGSLALQPRVEVTRVECLGEASGSADECLPLAALQWLQNEVESRLLDCYADTLRAHGRRQGALSLRVALSDRGEFSHPLVDIDALASEPTTACALTALTSLSLPANPTYSIDLGLVVIFKANKHRTAP